MRTIPPDPTSADLDAMFADVANALGVLFFDVLPEQPQQLALYPVAVSA